MKDLVRGSIVAPPKEVWQAYQHFAHTEGVKILEIKSLSKIKVLQNITVLFEFEETFIGEM